jgi:hypothetical protein
VGPILQNERDAEGIGSQTMRYRQLDRRHLRRGRQTGGHREPCSAGCRPIMACQSPSIAFVPNWAVAISSQATVQCSILPRNPLSPSPPGRGISLPAQAPPAIMPKQPAASSPPFPLFSSLPFPLLFLFSPYLLWHPLPVQTSQNPRKPKPKAVLEHHILSKEFIHCLSPSSFIRLSSFPAALLSSFIPRSARIDWI